METMILPDTISLDNGDVEISNDVYDVVIVDDWQTEQHELDGEKNWCSNEELLAEIYVDQPDDIYIENVPDDRHIFTSTSESVQQESNDCIDLSWLLNFKLDDIMTNLNEERSPDDGGEKRRKDEKTMKKTSTDHDTETDSQKQMKPPYTYTKLIEMALREKGELTVSGIYQWISEHFPFFKPYDDRWKNSVRHNLSISPHFRKGAKASRGAGHLWTVATPSALDRQLDDELANKKHELEPSMEQEIEAAAASILPHESDIISPVSVEHVSSVYDLFNGPLSFTY